MPHQWVTFTPKISVLAPKMGSGERACVRFFHAPVKKCLSIGVSEIGKMKKRQSHRISAKVLILNAPPMSDVHTKNQRPSSKNGLGRACLRPWIAGAPKSLHGILTSTEAPCFVSPIKGHRKLKMNIFTFRWYLVFLLSLIRGLRRSGSTKSLHVRASVTPWDPIYQP